MVRAWQRRDGPIAFHAAALGAGDHEHLGIAIERMRFALGVDDDYRELYDAFRSDRLLGGAIRRKRWHRPRRRPWAWEALAWSITKQLIESSRAAEIQRRMVLRWGARHEGVDGATLRDVPTPESIADRAPAELAAFDLAPARALALIRAAREICAGRVDPCRSRRRPSPARDPGDRSLDHPVPRPLRPWRARLPAGRRPRLRQAGGPARGPWPPRDRRGGGGVLRPVRARTVALPASSSSQPITGRSRRARRCATRRERRQSAGSPRRRYRSPTESRSGGRRSSARPRRPEAP